MFNNYFPYQPSPFGYQPGVAGYQPYNPGQYQAPQQNMMGQQQNGQSQFQQGMVSTNKLFANGIEDVKSRILPNNSDYLFLDNDHDILYRRMTDATGKVVVDSYDITRRENKEENHAQTIDTSRFVLREDFDKLKSEVEAYKNKVSSPMGMGLSRMGEGYEEK